MTPAGGALVALVAGGLFGSACSRDARTVEELSCLQTLFAQCPLVGSCQASSGDMGASALCLDSGVRRITDPVGNACGAVPSGVQRSLTRVFKANGSLCYSYEYDCDCSQGCESATFVWKDARGIVVASGGEGRNASVQCTTGESCSSDENTFPGCHPVLPELDCVAGSCP